MSGTRTGQDAPDTRETQETEHQIDEALEDTFPASDPPATGGTTGPGDTRPED